MARPRSFDRDDALDRALAAFEKTGYEATSFQDIVDATGLSRSSLYGAFGSKHALYLAALDRFQAHGAAQLDALFAAAPTALAGIGAYLDRIVQDAADGAEPAALGCFVTNTAVERAARDAETARRARSALEGMVDTLRRQIERAQAEGDVPRHADASVRAMSLVTTVYGLRALAKSGLTRDEAERVATEALRRLAE